MIRNQNGVALIGFVVALPLLVLLLMSFFWLTWFITLKQQSQNLCHAYLLRAQMSLVETNNQILALNPKALALIKEKKVLNLILRTGPMQARALAKVRKKQVLAKQKLLKLKQKSLFLKARGQSLYFYNQGQQQLKTSLQKKVQFWKPNTQPASMRWKTRPRHSKLRKDIRDLAPTYKRGPRHSYLQSMTLTWSMDIHDLAPPWMRRLIPHQAVWQRRWVASCSSHPHKGDAQWQASIGVARAL